jgi:hypothetical protein
LLISAIIVGAERAVVLENMTPFQAIGRGWRLIWSKFADYFTIGLLFLVIGLVVGVLFVCLIAPIFVGSLFGSLSRIEPGTNIFIGTAAGPVVIVFLLIFAVFGALVSLLASGVWTLAYRHWLAQTPPPSLAVQ